MANKKLIMAEQNWLCTTFCWGTFCVEMVLTVWVLVLQHQNTLSTHKNLPLVKVHHSRAGQPSQQEGTSAGCTYFKHEARWEYWGSFHRVTQCEWSCTVFSVWISNDQVLFPHANCIHTSSFHLWETNKFKQLLIFNLSPSLFGSKTGPSKV